MDAVQILSERKGSCLSCAVKLLPRAQWAAPKSIASPFDEEIQGEDKEGLEGAPEGAPEGVPDATPLPDEDEASQPAAGAFQPNKQPQRPAGEVVVIHAVLSDADCDCL